jgi:hypothetical protein
MAADNRVFDWDDEIQEESSFILIPEGEYKFTVEKVERGNYDGSDKIPPCKKAIVTFIVHAPEGDVRINENYFLCYSQEWKLSQLFLSVGLKKHGEKLRMNWTGLPGLSGFCKVYIDTYSKKNGGEGQSNKIDKLYAYDEQPKNLRAAVQNNGWTAGAF